MVIIIFLLFLVLLVQFVLLNQLNSNYHSAINSSNFPALRGPRESLTLPVEILHESDDGDGVVKVFSAIYRNISDLFLFLHER